MRSNALRSSALALWLGLEAATAGALAAGELAAAQQPQDVSGGPAVPPHEHWTLIAVFLAVFLVQTMLILKLAQEVRRRRLVEKTASDQQEQIEAAVTGAGIGVWNWQPNSDALWTTERCREILGIDPATKPDRETLLNGLHPEDRLVAVGRLKHMVETGDVCMREYRVPQPDGEDRWILSRATPKKDAQGNVDHIIGIVADITDRKRAEVLAEKQRQELTHLTRVSILGTLSGALAHELNQPLTAILSNAQAAQRLLGRKRPDLDEVRTILADIAEDDRRAGEVIRNLRSLLRKEDPKRELLQPNDIVSGVLEICQSDLLFKQVSVETRLAPDLPQISGDPVQIRQVLLNLIVNSCEAMAASKPTVRTLTISTDVVDSGRVRFYVADTGGGIAEGEMRDLFKPYFTTKNLGLGLGLPICQWIVAAHGGRLAAHNNQAGGATFSFELPSAFEERQDAADTRRVSGGR